MDIESRLREKGLYGVNNTRYLKFYVSYIRDNLDALKSSYECQDKEELQQKIRLIFNNAHCDLESHVEEMNKQALNNFLPDKSFEWIDKREDRIVYFAWSILRLVINRKQEGDKYSFGYTLRLNLCLENLKNEDENLYFNSNLNRLPLNKSEMRELIFDFFDQKNAKASAKEKLMNLIKDKWLYVSNDIDPDYSWIEEKNKKQNIWIYNYLKAKGYFLPHLTKPVSASQYYNTNIAILDSLFVLTGGSVINTSVKKTKETDSDVDDIDTPQEKSQQHREQRLTSDKVMYKMMKAWKQQLYREKQD